ncbi:MAG TPA: acetamidase/formamidase family protein [Chloroflexota bacterium]|jgi:acetamidase/formamidase|nr:acetamidase/formamidase family protein [Chloroflexota bacterium]
MTTHTIDQVRETLHGHFSRDLKPVVTVDSGDTIICRTLDAGWHVGPSAEEGEWNSETRAFVLDPELDQGHALCGPIAVRGAEPGMTLEVAVTTLQPGSWGWTGAGGGWSELNKRFGTDAGDMEGLRWSLNAAAREGVDQHGHSVKLNPFMGVMGMPPDLPGIHPTSPPRFCGGNIDCKELLAGTSLHLPVSVPGALFSIGDGHAAQGDGEISGMAIECPMDRVEFRLILHPKLSLAAPRARLPNAWLTFGFDEDLDEATVMAVNGMLDLLMDRVSCSRKEALGLASVAVDLRITQIVNGVRGVHAVLADDAISAA